MNYIISSAVTVVAIIIPIAAVLLAGVVLFMVIKNKKKSIVDVDTTPERDALLADRELVNENAQAVSALTEFTGGDLEIFEKASALADAMKYLSPSGKEEVKNIDESIKATVSRAKDALINADGAAARSAVRDIEIKIAERKVYTER